MPINTVAELQEHLQLAVQVELSTIPPYLYTMYSIEDQQSEPALLIRSIAVEEMLHAALVANILLGVGGSPRFGDLDWMPNYPMDVPHHMPPLTMNLEPATRDGIAGTLLILEQPEVHGAPAEADMFETLGQFYHALEIGLEQLAAGGDLFANPQRDYQMGEASYYSPVAYDTDDSGGLQYVVDLESAREAIHVIVHQGEGLGTEKWADPGHKELTHYFKLLRIVEGESPLGAVRPAAINPKTSEYPAGLQSVSNLYNALYRSLFMTMDQLFLPQADKGMLVGLLYQLMSGWMHPLARFLMDQPITDGLVAGPTFEPFDFGDQAVDDVINGLLAASVDAFPALSELLPHPLVSPM